MQPPSSCPAHSSRSTRRAAHRRSARTAIGLVSAAGLVLGACSGGDDESAGDATTVATTTTTVADTTPSTTTTTSTTTTSTTTTTLPMITRQPLTGAPLGSEDEVIDRPALVIKIDNHQSARRNQSGLAVADIVFEELVEGQLSRFAAVFHSQGSDTVGPIRSGRTQDVDLLAPFGRPLFAWSGGNRGVTRMIAEADLIDLNAVRNGRGYYRGPGTAPHNLYNSTDRLWEQTPEEHPGPPPQQFVYVRPEESVAGEPVAVVKVAIGGVNVEWTWDDELGAFRRAQAGAAHVDSVHGAISATNVVVMAVEYRPSPVDASSPEAQTVGEGPVYVFSDGQVRAGRWIRTGAEQPIRFFETGTDTPIPLVPGNTWVELAKAESSGDPANPDIDMTIVETAE